MVLKVSVYGALFAFLLKLKYFLHSTKTKIAQIYSTKCHQKQIISHFSHLVPVLNPIKTLEKTSKTFFFIVSTNTNLSPSILFAFLI
jgi:hypothetical protein